METCSPRKLRSGASSTRRSQPRPSLTRASSRTRPLASTGCRASSRYPNETRSLGTSRRKIGSPVVTRPSGYTSFRRTEAEYSNRPWWTYASATGSVTVVGAGEREDCEQGEEHARDAERAQQRAADRPTTLAGRAAARDEPLRSEPRRRRVRPRRHRPRRPARAASRGRRGARRATGSFSQSGDPADLWRAQPELAHDLLFRRLLAVEEVVVVALENEPAVLHPNDPVQNVRAELQGPRRGRRHRAGTCSPPG